MSSDAGGLLIAITGAVALRLAITGAYLSYLQPGMRWPLAVAGTLMVLLGVTTLIRSFRSSNHDGDHGDAGDLGDHQDHDGHGHGHGSRVPWLLALPTLAILLVAPAPLGADAARRESDVVQAAPSTFGGFSPLAAERDGAVDLSLSDFLARSFYDDDETLAGRPVRLTGFVVHDPEVAGGYQLTRFQLSCCAADAFALQVAVHGAPAAPPDDTWVEVVGEWVPPADPSATGADRGAHLAVIGQTEVPAPANPYE